VFKILKITNTITDCQGFQTLIFPNKFRMNCFFKVSRVIRLAKQSQKKG